MAPQNQQPRRTQPQPLPGRGLNPVLCIIVALVLLGLLVGLAILITYLTLRPKTLVYTVEAASVQDFAIAKDDHISAKFNYVIKSYNPEKHVSVRYHSMRISTAHHNQSVAHKEISAFKQRPKNETRIETQLVSHNVALSKFNAKDLRAETTKGVIEMEVYITARVSYKTWIFRSRRRTLKGVCTPIMINVTANSLDGFQRVLCKTRL
ncbi:unnamed protein product [Brassica oleracea var. botrytis]|uniref:Late embryogenesis abundant protein LEA-2 subgroup domain-containing protein n=4 Tax=Brassica TaxID=3705 RepID=A0A0D3DYG5_BRAOL|nr:PREDICTED: uncharacterized protein At1g08160-like [Brassica oleracea var. oleracea]XP_013695250.1 uncharacterized protein At1g08160 [Brassica napus]KAF3494501.1 hypothetical protein DY000_02058053 [Brassica cretica]VDD59314.1 unnamed protein product [Brassica oleracea]CAF2116229.1 unnamed protein product [Brassica napus]CDY22699.1 BnaC08g43330D [Brassica napus]